MQPFTIYYNPLRHHHMVEAYSDLGPDHNLFLVPSPHVLYSEALLVDAGGLVTRLVLGAD